MQAFVRGSSRLSASNRSFSTLYSRGCGVFGALSLDNDLRDEPVFKPVPWRELVDERDVEIASVSAGWGHSLAVSTAGNLYVWGRPYDFSSLMRLDKIHKVSTFLGRMAALTTNSSLLGKSDQYGFFAAPQLVPSHGPVREVSASAGLTAFLTEEGDVFCFGLNRWQQCGIVSLAKSSSERRKMDVTVSSEMHVKTPVKVQDLPRCQKIDTGLQHCLALTKNGEVFSWGKGSRGQLGHLHKFGVDDASTLARKVSILDSSGKAKKVKDISAGFAHSAAATEDGELYVWGKGMSDVVKTENKKGSIAQVCEDQFMPRHVVLPGNRKAIELCCSHFSLVIRADDATLWALGVGEHDRNSNPFPIQIQNDFRVAETKGSSPFVTFPPHLYKLKKGHKRVSLHSDMEHVNTIIEEEEATESQESKSKIGSAFWDYELRKKYTKSFDIVLHEGEAYLIGLDLNSKMLVDPNTEHGVVEGNFVDYSEGWKHDLILVK